MSPQPEYDIVFAGGGTAACVTARRLASAFPHLSILLLERGPTTKNKAEHVQPGQCSLHLAPGSKTMSSYTSAPSESLGGRSVVVSFGQCVGGSSSVNWMVYNRPAASDLDEWEKTFGNKGWGAKDMIPLFEKSEDYEIEPGKPTHGSEGPLKVSYGAATGLNFWQEFVDIGSQIKKDRPKSDEGNGFDANSVNVFFRIPKWISSAGRRSDVAHHYVYNNDFANLSVFDECHVSRVLIENGVASGVEYVLDKQEDFRIVKARKLVVVSAGAMGSPLILERSGIGRKDLLERVGVPVVADLPGVGENYQDHAVIAAPYILDSNSDSMTLVAHQGPETLGAAEDQWNHGWPGFLGTNGVEAAIKLRPHAEELAELGPEFTEYWNEEFADKPDKPLLYLGNFVNLPFSQAPFGDRETMAVFCYLCYPESRGYLHISSSANAVNFQAGFLSHAGEVAALRWGYKKGREIARRFNSYRGEAASAHPTFKEGSAAALTETLPVSLDAPRLTYSSEDDDAIDAFIRQTAQTNYHSVGTCAMKPLEQGGVVDDKLNVYGIQKLKVADLSILPSNVNSNTYSTAIAIGEKAAVIIADELLSRSRL